MPITPPTPCKECGRTTCDHRKTKAKNTYRRPLGDLYSTTRWQKETSPMIKRHNPFCQVIETATGIRCDRLSAVVHHLVDPKDNVTLFHDPSNLVAICKHHHGHWRGEPENAPRWFAPTLGALIFGIQASWPHPEKPKDGGSTVGPGLFRT